MHWLVVWEQRTFAVMAGIRDICLWLAFLVNVLSVLHNSLVGKQIWLAYRVNVLSAWQNLLGGERKTSFHQLRHQMQNHVNHSTLWTILTQRTLQNLAESKEIVLTVLNFEWCGQNAHFFATKKKKILFLLFYLLILLSNWNCQCARAKFHLWFSWNLSSSISWIVLLSVMSSGISSVYPIASSFNPLLSFEQPFRP